MKIISSRKFMGGYFYSGIGMLKFVFELKCFFQFKLCILDVFSFFEVFFFNKNLQQIYRADFLSQKKLILALQRFKRFNKILSYI